MAFENYIKKVVAEANQGQTGRNVDAPKGPEKTTTCSPLQRLDKRNANKPVSGIQRERDFIKSPSDTTIYAPALALAKSPEKILSPVRGNLNIATAIGNTDISNQISDFIQGIRIQSARPASVVIQPSAEDRRAATSSRLDTSRREGDEFHRHLDQAKEKASQLIIEAEKFKASVNNPPGTSNVDEQNINIPVMNLLIKSEELTSRSESCNCHDNAGKAGPRAVDVDDEFFHATCHIDAGIKARIQRGEFVELD